MIPAVLVAGCGGTGVLFSAILAESNINVYVIDDPEGVMLSLPMEHVMSIPKGKSILQWCMPAAKLIQFLKVNVVFLLVKSWQTERQCRT